MVSLSELHISILVGGLIIILALSSLWLFKTNGDKEMLIANLTQNISKLQQSYSFIDDYNEYSMICNRMQNDKADILKKQCTSQGFDFSSYYVSYPSNDFLIVCMTPQGKAQILRFR